MFTDTTSLLNFQNYFLDVYIKPYARWTPYFMGLYSGIFYFNYQNAELQQNNSLNIRLAQLKATMQSNKLVRIAFEWIGVCIMAFIVLIPRTLQLGFTWPQIIHSIYFCFSKPLFIIGMTMMILPTILGIKNSFFRLILDCTLFNCVAKVSFCTYLVHLMFIYQFYTSRSYDMYSNVEDGLILYLGCLVMSCILGFVLTALV